jgi:shikimate kinase
MKKLILGALFFSIAPPAGAEIFEGTVSAVSQKAIVLTDRNPSGQAAHVVINVDEETDLKGLAYVTDLKAGEPVTVEAERTGMSGEWKAETVARDPEEKEAER